MATAEELLSRTSEVQEEILTVDLNTRVISIPATLTVLGVEYDDDVKRLQFRMPQHYGEFDLSTFKFNVNYKNAKGKGDFYPVDDMTAEDDMLTFSWLVDRHAFASAGDVNFSLCMKLYGDDNTVVKELNTTPATLPVLKGLETEQAVASSSPGAFDQILCRLYAIEAATGNGQQGTYSIAKVTETEDGAVFTIINSDGTTEAVVRHGKDGTNGYVPIKGIDYWNADDVLTITKDANDRINSFFPKNTTVTLSTNWSGGVQTVTVNGVTPDSMIFVSPHPSASNSTAYSNAGIRCIEQGNNTLKFQCTITPTVAIQVNVVSYYTNNSSDEGGGGTSNFMVVDDGNGNVTIL